MGNSHGPWLLPIEDRVQKASSGPEIYVPSGFELQVIIHTVGGVEQNAGADELHGHVACGERLPGSSHAADYPRALGNGLHRHPLHRDGPDGDGSLRASTEQRQRYEATFRAPLHGSPSSTPLERSTVSLPC